MPTLPAFSKRGKPTNYNLINFFLYAFWRARKIVFIYWFLLVFIVNSFFFSFFSFFLLYSLCEQLWFIFLEFNNLRERERKEVGDKTCQCQEAECRYGLSVFWLWWLSWTVFHHSCKRFSRNLLHTSFFSFFPDTVRQETSTLQSLL